jgi:hypothetical protein
MDVETDLPARRVNGRMWAPGQPGNPSGRPIGARGRFRQQFVEACARRGNGMVRR